MTVERIDQAGSVKGKGALAWNEKISGKRALLLVMPNWLDVTEPAIIGEYDIPTPASGTRCIAPMSDGRLFFTQWDAGLIGEVIP